MADLSRRMDQYKQAIQSLSDELTTTTDPREVAAAVERTVCRWVPCAEAELRVASPDGEPPTLWNGSSADDLALPARFNGRHVGWLVVRHTPATEAFSEDDVDLLRTIASQAALALAHANGYAELERRRQEQAAAWHTERIALVETVAAEIAHEVRYPINFFRSVFRRDKGNTVLDAEEIDIGCEEVERLERLVSGLRRIAASRIERHTQPVADLAARVETLLRDALRGRVLEVDLPAGAAVRCDPHQATQLLVNLVANAIDATPPGGALGVQWSTSVDGAKLTVWDDGPGFQGDASRLFAPWFTTKSRGTGLGLAITQRIVRAHGWSIDAERAGDRTRFVVSIPSSDVVGAERSARGDGDEDPDRR